MTEISLPTHEFFYTLDQIAVILGVEEPWLRKRIFFVGRMPDANTRDLIRAFNIAESESSPQWRVSDRELRRWLHRKGFKPK